MRSSCMERQTDLMGSWNGCAAKPWERSFEVKLHGTSDRSNGIVEWLCGQAMGALI